MQCDMCGSSSNLVRSIVEGTEMNVCTECAKFGKVLGKVKSKEDIQKEQDRVKEYLEKKRKPVEPEQTESVVPNFSELIRKKRESLGLTQDEFARKLNEKGSIIHKLETGSMNPSIELAHKIQRKLHLRLVEMQKSEKNQSFSKSSGPVTIGDMITIRKR